MAVRAGGLRHDALFYGSDRELVAAARPFARAGLDAGESVVVISDHNLGMLADALGHDPRVTFLAGSDVYQRVTATIAAFQQIAEQHLAAGATGIRVIGEVAFRAEPAQWNDWVRFESVVNAAFAPLPLWTVCPYDTRRLAARVLDAAALTHPTLLTGVSRAPSPRYLETAEYLLLAAPADPDPLEETAPALDMSPLGGFAGLRQLRAEARVVLAAAGVPRAAASNFVTAVSEIASNALSHGRAATWARLWSAQGRSVCVITDRGDGPGDPIAGYLPPDREDPAAAGLGLWLARQLCDHVITATTPDGFTVRLTSAH
jgi:anti-sigma regulatory factor (Ser/Thr protein kinase)